MKLAYNVTGKDRKALTNIIVEIIGEEAVYQNAPTYSYTIGAFTITREGELEIADTVDEAQIKAVVEALSKAGFNYKNSDILSISYPLEGMSDTVLDNLNKMVKAKSSLLKKAFEVEDLPIEQNGDELIFAWFKGESTAEEIHAYSQFIAKLCETAKSKTRVNATAPESFENEKFAMRVFGIGLGLVGKEYSLCRKLLMNNLEGNSSWRYTAPEGETKPRRERVHKEVISIRLTPETLEKLAILASQSNMSRNMLVESVVAEYIQSEYSEGEIQTAE
jgi:hypothetical protein